MNEMLNGPLKDLVNDEKLIKDDMTVNELALMDVAGEMIGKLNEDPNLSDEDKTNLNSLVADSVK
jgi:hypothetical protein